MTKTSKTEKNPSLLGVYFFAVLLALFSGLLGFVYMAAFPAQAFSSEAEYAAFLAEAEDPLPAPKPGDAYHLEGVVAATRSWEAKRAQLAAPEPQSIELTAGEFNAWMAAKFRRGGAATSAPARAADDKPGLLITPGVPNVALTDAGTLYLNLPTSIDAYGYEGDYVITALCSVDAAGLHFIDIKVGSARVPLPSLLGARLLEGIAQSYEATEEYAILAAALERAETVEVLDGRMRIRTR